MKKLKKSPNTFRKLLSFLLLILSLVIIASTFWPMKRDYVELPFPEIQLEDADSFIFGEDRVLELDVPQRIRLGDHEAIHLQVKPDDSENSYSNEELMGAAVNIYNAYNLVIEARLDLGGIEVSPSGSISEPLLPGQTLNFYWCLRPGTTGQYRGNLWLYLNLISKKGGTVEQIALIAKPVVVECVPVLGLPIQRARLVGYFCIGLCIIFGYPTLKSLLSGVLKSGRKDNFLDR